MKLSLVRINYWLLVLRLNVSVNNFLSCRDRAIASWVIDKYFRGLKCPAHGQNPAAVVSESRPLALESHTLPLNHHATLNQLLTHFRVLCNAVQIHQKLLIVRNERYCQKRTQPVTYLHVLCNTVQIHQKPSYCQKRT